MASGGGQKAEKNGKNFDDSSITMHRFTQECSQLRVVTEQNPTSTTAAAAPVTTTNHNHASSMVLHSHKSSLAALPHENDGTEDQLAVEQVQGALYSERRSIQMSSSSASLLDADQWLCAAHSTELKRVEAFCSDCCLPLCMGCILTNRHTAHSIISLVEANRTLAEKVNSLFKTVLADGVKQVTKLAESLASQLSQLSGSETAFFESLERKLEEVMTQVRQAFAEMREKAASKFQATQSEIERS